MRPKKAVLVSALVILVAALVPLSISRGDGLSGAVELNCAEGQGCCCAWKAGADCEECMGEPWPNHYCNCGCGIG